MTSWRNLPAMDGNHAADLINEHSHGTAELDRDACLQLLATKTLGRLIYTENALPAVAPVRYLLDAETLVFRTAGATRIFGGRDDTVVAFEADELDPDTDIGRVVTVVGSASILSPSQASQYCPKALRPFGAGADARHVVAMTLGVVDGRRITN